jgi:DNA-binding Lrp family transcriptional regulator
MPTSGVQLDAKDRMILSLLESNAREPIQKLAARVGLSRSSTHERVARLRRTGVIAGFTIKRTVPRTASGVSAYLLLYLTGPICERVAKEIERFPEVKRSQSIGGEIDMILQVETGDIAGLNELRTEIEQVPGVVKIVTGIVLCDRFDRSAGAAEPVRAMAFGARGND